MFNIENLAKDKPEKWQVISNKIDANFTEVSTNVSKKLDAVEGKQLSTEDYTTVEKTKLSGIAENANNYQHPANHAATMITEDSTHRFVTDEEKNKWNAVLDTSNFATNESVALKADKTDLGGLKFWKGNKQAYEAISPKDENTLYIVIE